MRGSKRNTTSPGLPAGGGAAGGKHGVASGICRSGWRRRNAHTRSHCSRRWAAGRRCHRSWTGRASRRATPLPSSGRAHACAGPGDPGEEGGSTPLAAVQDEASAAPRAARRVQRLALIPPIPHLYSVMRPEHELVVHQSGCALIQFTNPSIGASRPPLGEKSCAESPRASRTFFFRSSNDIHLPLFFQSFRSPRWPRREFSRAAPPRELNDPSHYSKMIMKASALSLPVCARQLGGVNPLWVPEK